MAIITQQLNPIQVLGSASDFLDPEAIIEKLDIHPGMRIGDFGSGSGFMALSLAKKVGDSGIIYAVDILDSALETLRAKANALGLANIQTLRGNLEVPGGSGLNDESQDLVLLVNILFQNDKKDAIAREAKRVLKAVRALFPLRMGSPLGMRR